MQQPFFKAEGQVVKVNTADLQTVEFASAEASGAYAVRVTPDGGSISSDMVAWIFPPHCIKSQRVRVSYLGDDRAVS